MEGVGQFAADNFTVDDPQLLKEGLYQHELEAVGGFSEQLARVEQQAERLVKAALNGFQGDGQLGNGLLGRRDAAAGGVLFLFELLPAERVSKVGFLVLLGPLLELVDTFFLAGGLRFVVGVLAIVLLRF